MARVVQSGVRHRIVFELRYESGELYWDRCGRVARVLAAKPGWSLQLTDVNGCHIWNEDQNLTFTYSPTKLDLVQSQNQDVSDLLSSGEFAVIAEEFCETVVRNLEVDFFPRIGFRLWTLYGTESVDDASSRIADMSFFSPSKALDGLGELSNLSHSVVIARPTHMVRVAATPFEQQVHIPPSVIAASRQQAHRHWKDQKKVLLQKLKAKKAIEAYPSVGVMIDLDAFIEDVPYPDEVAVHTFIEEATKGFDAICEVILSREEEI